MNTTLITPDDYRKLKQASLPQVIGWATRIYRQGYEDGLRDAEKEFDDPELYQIVDADTVREAIGDEAYDKLIGGSSDTD